MRIAIELSLRVACLPVVFLTGGICAMLGFIASTRKSFSEQQWKRASSKELADLAVRELEDRRHG